MSEIIIIGNPVEGFDLIGPFKDSQEAIAYADEHLNNEDWWIVELTDPYKPATDEEIERSFDAYR